jgi:hypothetical protein
LAGKSSTTKIWLKPEKTTKEEQGLIFGAFFLRDLGVLGGEKGFPVKNGRTGEKKPKDFRNSVSLHLRSCFYPL